jgi:peptidoglycan/xylan/chitin deacetylase (PgdA/CDA1 family)
MSEILKSTPERADGTPGGSPSGVTPPWAWEESRWRGIVDRVRAGRPLRPRQWKDGARVAVALSFDSDHESGELRDGGEAPVRLSQGQYGARVAVPRILRLMTRYSIPVTFFVPAVVASIYPDEQRRLVGEGHEVGLHGWIHERNSLLPAGVELDLFRRCIETLESITGIAPVGLRAPSFEFSPATLSVVRQLGLLYDSSMMADDEPYELLENGQATGVVEIPAEWIRSDGAYFNMDRFSALRPYTTPFAVLEIWRAEFDMALQEGGLFQLTLHPHIIGHRSRLAMLEALIEHMCAQDRVWFATHEQIARYVKAEA